MSPNRAALMTAIAGFCALAMALGLGRFGYTALLPAMQTGGLSDAGAGVIAAANLFAYMAASWAVGKTPPRWWRRGFLGALAVSAVTTWAMAITADPLAWALLRAVGGAASAGVMVLGAGLMLDRLVALGKVDWAGMAFAGTGLGIALSGIVALVADDPGAGWFALGVLAVLAALPALVLGFDGPRHAQEATAAPSVATADEATTRLTIAYGLEGFGYSIAGTFLVAVVARAGGIDLAGWSWILAGVSAIPAFLVWRFAALHLGIWRALGLAYAVQAVGISLPALSGAPLAAIAGAVGFGGTFLAITALTMAEARRVGGMPAIGRLTATYGVGQALGPLLAGWLAEAQGDFDIALLLAGACVLGGGVILLSHRIRRSKPCPS